ncbi:carbohydrate ABC transporter permease [Gracilibacillus sp. YIM 98692]|uniref:carbohydrate ABC transporter permease n=1 Tax=Gracilibacillus sp. YIM 98692 TaxID=2663532 RepID=UPI0013D6E0E1|nr:carbohydrate ABC transporter permease [Gracilibacillus sp. YIM 98692]
MSQQTIKDSGSDRLFIIFIYLFLTAVLVVVLYPLVYILSASLSSPSAVAAGKVWLLPVDFSLEGFKAVFSQSSVLRGYANTLFYTTLGTTINIILTIMIAYPLSRKTFVGRGIIMFLLVFTMLFEGGLIPLYLTVKNLGMLDSIWAMLLPNALMVWQVIIARTFFQMTIPEELSEAAQLDGCSDLAFMLKIVLPLSKPIVAVLILMYAVFHWNSYFEALMFLSSRELYPLQLVLREIVIMNTVDISNITDVASYSAQLNLANQLKYSLIVLTTLPILLIYPFVQKHFVRGMLIGSVKE